MQWFLRILREMANSVDHDQEQSDLGLHYPVFAYAILSETLVYKILGHLPYLYNNFYFCFCTKTYHGYSLGFPQQVCSRKYPKDMF